MHKSMKSSVVIQQRASTIIGDEPKTKFSWKLRMDDLPLREVDDVEIFYVVEIEVYKCSCGHEFTDQCSECGDNAFNEVIEKPFYR